MSYLGGKRVLCVVHISVQQSFWTCAIYRLRSLGYILSCLKSLQKKNIFTIIFVAKSLIKGFGWNNVGPASQTVAQHYFTIGPMYRFIREVAFRGIKRPRMAVRANTGQSPNSVSMLGQCLIRLTGTKPAMGSGAGPTSNRYWVGRPTLCVPGTSHRRVHWLISDGGGRNRPTRWRYTCLIDSFKVNYILEI